tara:strand:+ start:13 stop:843 length:831 start_codon:yes stop_codon:yes gene_type:complete
MKVFAMFLSRLFLVAACAAPLAPAAAHEYWIEAEAYQVDTDDTIQAYFKNGQSFAGINLAFFDRSSTRFDQVFDGAVTPVTARAGDSPALQLESLNADGLLVVVHETSPATLTYKEWDKFLKFAEHKDFKTAAADHAANGWSQEKFKESYTRHIKALIGVGTGAGNDASQGLETEFVARTNPYADGFDGQMSVVLNYQGQPRPDAQIEVFDRTADDSVTITLHRTDAQGEATIPVTPGHIYLFDAVVLRPAPDAGDDPDAPVWETLWAALTFAVPQ